MCVERFLEEARISSDRQPSKHFHKFPCPLLFIKIKEPHANIEHNEYRLHAGKNFIGRSLTMDVPIVGDKSVARNKHCSVVYEPKDNTFFIAGESGNVVYLNDKTVENFAELGPDDVLRIGETELVMVPYCKEDRRWEKV